MNFRGPATRRVREFELVPLIDVVFTLLLFFALTTTFARPEEEANLGEQAAATGEAAVAGMEVQLPRAGADALVDVRQELAVEIAEDGSLRFGGRAVDLSELSALFRSAQREGARATVILRADGRAAHGRVVEVMDMARELGLTDFAIATERGP